jgi:Filamentous haemagglutinin family outer membrane protein
MDDRDPALTGTVLAPLQFSNIDGSDPLRTFRARVNDRFESHAAAILHKGDTAPSYIVALTGDVTGGTSERLFNLTLAEQARIFAGRDIVDIGFSGQNTGNTDITSIAAGRDITYTLTTGVGGAPKIVNGFDVGSRPVQVPVGGFYAIGGDGQFTLVAGRDLKIAPGLAADVRTVAENNLTGVTGLRTAGRAQGVLAIGNTDNGYLTGGSANVNVLFGVGPGLNIAGFVDRYINPANSASAPGTYSTQLAAFINARATAAARAQNPGTTFVSSLSAADAWAVFRTLPENQQQAFVQQVFYSEIRVAADQQNFPDQYQNFPRVYAAIETLFPAAYGYSNNSATTSTRVSTGNLDMVGASLRTDFGGDINILGPGGGATLGGLSVVDTAPPQGVLTARGGNINIFTDQNLQVNSSRIFTLLGGDITSFSSSGNIDAGRGRKTSAFFPPLQVNYAPNTTASIDSAGLITGAGIGTLQSIPGSALGNVYLLAPRGDIDAGDAGIRASGNLFVVAQRVLNADNVQIGGKSFGVPKAPVVSVTQVVGSSAKPIDPSQIDPKAGDATKGRSITQITVQVTGFGEPEDIRKKRKKTTK